MLNKNKIRIGVDAKTIFLPNRGSTAKILINLYKRIPLLEPSLEFYLYYMPNKSSDTNSIFSDIKNIKKRAVDIKGYRFLKNYIWEVWENISLPLAASVDRIDLLHYFAGKLHISFYAIYAKVLTIYDLTNIKFDLGLPQRIIRIFRKSVEYGLKTAKKIITLSEYSKRDILDTFGKQYEDKIEVIYCAPEDNCQPVEDKNKINMIKNKYSINSPYIFHFGRGWVHKNTVRLLKGFSVFSQKVKKDVQLIIAGTWPQFLGAYRALAGELRIENKVVFTYFIPEEDIPFLLSGAEFLVFASLYEGFGLPPLDAMACDCPVIASNVTSIPEVVGDAAILVNPYDVNEIADAMVNLFGNSQLRKELIEKGRERIKHFSWDKAAKETLGVYREALGIRKNK